MYMCHSVLRGNKCLEWPCGFIRIVYSEDLNQFQLAGTLDARGFFSLEATEFSGEAPTAKNLISMPTPISFDWHSQSEKTEQTG